MGMDAGLVVRDALPQEGETVAAILLEAYGQYESELPADRWMLYQEAIRASVHSEAPLAKIVAVLDGEIAGSVQLFRTSHEAYGLDELDIQAPFIRYLAVPPRFRGHGIATALIADAARRTAGQGATWLHLHTSDMMRSAVTLYERLGFERATNTDFHSGETLVKGYKLDLSKSGIFVR
ncbi:GNAT family N-acetyltransferase [Paenibacillus beijingensis]|uniref:GCN5 family acetyltransferase n=1 Tax=Paenibacillus beijingensis TaxID=1126833 RepID=A0A0D5NFC8_9BACL|nr:GNAT family N-acetyltransferase [Paenibacillus beijingensis]AJY73662.1 GCN5 family acetyltransferase [Paenibacillus beijingensis]